MNEFYQKDIISIKDYSKEQLEKIFTSTDKIMQLDPIQRREICLDKTKNLFKILMQIQYPSAF